jgi:hypothetical protein
MAVSVRRPASTVLAGIVDNLQDIVRSEAHLVKAELREEVRAARSPAMRIGAGLLLAFYAAGLFIAVVVVLLSRVLQVWAAAGIVCLVASCAALVLFSNGKRAWRRSSPKRAGHPVGEDISWTKAPNNSKRTSDPCGTS